jgi:hypothetical protein
MWFLPSFGRPDAPGKMLDAPGGMPEDVVVLVNEDDPALDAYVDRARSWPARWGLTIVPAGSRFAEAVRHGFDFFDQIDHLLPYYGIVDDDYWPITPGWWEKMIEAAGDRYIALANNKQNFPKPYCCRLMGGELARAIGTIAPGKMRHNFSDDAWGVFAQDFGLLRPLENVIVEHRHWIFRGEMLKDATYERGSSDLKEDCQRFAEWLNSDERRGQVERVAKLLGVTVAVNNFADVRLLMLTPIQNHAVDVAYLHSFERTQALLTEKRISRCIQQQSGSSHIGKAREHLLWAGLKQMPQATHILFVDDDMGWEPSLVTRLLAADHEFTAVSGVKKTDQLSLCYNAFPDPQVLHPRTKFMKVRHIGFAFVMLKRSVIDKLVEAYPELEYNTDGHGREFALFSDLMWRRAGKDLPERLSEDFSFCQRWQAIGGEIWMDPYAKLVHAGRKEYTGAAGEMLTPVSEEQLDKLGD